MAKLTELDAAAAVTSDDKLYVVDVATGGSLQATVAQVFEGAVSGQIATQAEAEAATDNTKIMTPLRAAQEVQGATLFTQTGTGASARTIISKLKEWVTPEDFGCAGDGTTTDTTNFQEALDAVSAAGGGCLLALKKYLVGNLTIPSNVWLCGTASVLDIRLTYNLGLAVDPYTLKSQLRTIAGTTITCSNGARVSNLIVIKQGLSAPATTNAQATTLKAQFADTAFTADNAGVEIDHCAILGYAKAIDFTNSGGLNISCKYNIHENLIDCLAGIEATDSGEYSAIWRNHIFPVLTFGIPSVTDANLQRSGAAINVLNNTEMHVRENMTFGFATGISALDSSSCVIEGNRCEYTSTGGGTNGIKFAASGTLAQYGSMATNLVIGYSAGIYIDATGASAGNDTFKLVGNTIINTASGTAVELFAGSLIATGNFIQNGSIGYKIDAGATGANIGNGRIYNATTPYSINATAAGLVTIDDYSGTKIGDAAYVMVATDRYVYTSAAFTAPRAWTLPAASSVPRGTPVVVQDAFNTVTSSNTLTIQAAGSDTINIGATSIALTNGGGTVILISDGVSNWGIPVYSVANGGTGQASNTNHGVILGSGSAPLRSLVGGAGTLLQGVASADPSFTATPTLGASGTLGSLTMGNATSGTVTVQPVTGALGTVTLSLPAATDTLVGKATTDILSNKTLATPIFTTSITGPLVIGGTGTGSSLELKSTSGVGATDFTKFTVGNNGATEAGRILTSGAWVLGTTTYDSNLTAAAGSLQLLNNFIISGSAPAFVLKRTDGPSNAKFWDSYLDSSGTWTTRAINDAYNSASNAMTWTRSGTTVSTQDLSGAAVSFSGITTTASAANAFLNSGSSPANSLLRSTSSLAYKKDVETVDIQKSQAALQLKPIWYRSKAKADNPGWSWYGLGAEDVAVVDPRLVHWGYHDEDWEIYEEIEDMNGKEISVSKKRLREGATLKPDGVMYDRVSILQIDALKHENEELKNAIADLAARVTAIETKH